MKTLAILMFLLGVAAILFTGSGSEQSDAHHDALALNYVVYREAVLHHVFVEGRKEPGMIDQSALTLPVGWRPLRPWSARVVGGRCLVWGPAGTEVAAIAARLLRGSFAVGTVQGGRLVPGHGAVVPVAELPEGSLVSVVELD